MYILRLPYSKLYWRIRFVDIPSAIKYAIQLTENTKMFVIKFIIEIGIYLRVRNLQKYLNIDADPGNCDFTRGKVKRTLNQFQKKKNNSVWRDFSGV